MLVSGLFVPNLVLTAQLWDSRPYSEKFGVSAKARDRFGDYVFILEDFKKLPGNPRLPAGGANRIVSLRPFLEKSISRIQLAQKKPLIMTIGKQRAGPWEIAEDIPFDMTIRDFSRDLTKLMVVQLQEKKLARARETFSAILAMNSDLSERTVTSFIIGCGSIKVLLTTFKDNLGMWDDGSIRVFSTLATHIATQDRLSRVVSGAADAAERSARRVVPDLLKGLNRTDSKPVSEDAGVSQFLSWIRGYPEARRKTEIERQIRIRLDRARAVSHLLIVPEYRWPLDGAAFAKFTEVKPELEILDMTTTAYISPLLVTVAKLRTTCRLFHLSLLIELNKRKAGTYGSDLSKIVGRDLAYDPVTNKEFVYSSDGKSFRLLSAGNPALGGEIELAQPKKR